MAALTVILMVLSPPFSWARETQSFFMHQFKCECRFSNGLESMRFFARYIYNTEEDVHFDSDVGEFTAVTELGRPDAEYWNRQKDFMEQMRAKVDTVCRSNYLGVGSFMRQRRVEPTVTVYPAKTQPLQHHNLLVCSVNGFYPGHIEVRWFQNGHEEEAGVISTGLIPNGDWTFQTMVMLETVPQSVEVYTCQVEHPSQKSPITVEWRAQSDSAQRKLMSGIGGFALGLLFLGVGLSIHFRSKKAVPQLSTLLCAGVQPRQDPGASARSRGYPQDERRRRERERRAPTVTVYPAKIQPLQHQNLLVCSVNGFYPGHIEVRWFWNGHEEEAGVISTGLIQNGNWVFQTLEMLESVPQSGEVYICQVEHPNQKSPITVEWTEVIGGAV
ncbi:DLA class II histocompatibility antigen, DR-1 beta chain-like [Muntiacus reevesi]|uniref:DLA class II histocompatibility antigen, DR-1 beta chain-like n=1 Tax=Muntiacus reevesi TaxID=9886 RepID=UPI003306D3AA